MNTFHFILLFLLWSVQLFGQTAPALPNTSGLETCFPDTVGYKRWTVGPINRDYKDLQLAINAADPGTVLVLDAGVIYPGSFSLPDKTGDGWVILMSSKANLLPKQGKRIAPSDATGDPLFPSQADAMPKIVTTNPAGLPCFRTLASAHHYRFVGLEIGVDTLVLNSYGLMFLGDGSSAQNSMEKTPHDLIVDRCYIHGHAKASIMKSGVLLNCANAAVLDSYISDFHSIGYDTYAIGGTNGPGPFIIRNNYLEAAGENILFGGAAPSIAGLVPADIEVRNNHFFKPFAWREGHPDYTGIHWTIKNLFELKTGKRVLLDGNILENCWADLPIGQSGYAILLTVRTEGGGAPQADVSDITITNNIIRRVGAGISLSGHDSPTPGLRSQRIRIANNLFEEISGADYGDGNIAGPNDGIFLKIGDPSDVLVEHNTVFQSGAITWAYDITENIVIRNNIFNCYLSDGGYQGIYGPGFAHGGNGPLGRYFPGISDENQGFHKNVLIGGDDFRYNNYNMLSQNYFPANSGLVGFLDYANGGGDYQLYALSTGSPYKYAATDGKDLGVDFEVLDGALSAQTNCSTLNEDIEAFNRLGGKVYPNPTNGDRIKLESGFELKDATIIVLDMLGREYLKYLHSQGSIQEIYLPGLPAGIYYYQILEAGRLICTGLVMLQD